MNGILQTEAYVLGGRIYPPSAILTKKEFKDPDRLLMLEKNIRNKGNGVYFGRDFSRNCNDPKMKTITDLNLSHLVLSNDVEYAKQQRNFKIAMSDEKGRLGYSTKLRNPDGSGLLQYSKGYVAVSNVPNTVQAHNITRYSTASSVGRISFASSVGRNSFASSVGEEVIDDVHAFNDELDLNGDGLEEGKVESRYANQRLIPSKWNGKMSLEGMKDYLMSYCGQSMSSINELQNRNQARSYYKDLNERSSVIQKAVRNRGNRRRVVADDDDNSF